ncbi:hypothetical protein PAECIP111893_01826 [Paenibacillus plantiphilus]|uniref:Uncharacterized protein n=2 Tax=Paenibacillus plantiphilus TaxID=2905650 RepID=A0ABM9C2W7_9BACL|nr:hypothetical protein PAECIP111893_01826 [Paenibacillus plantiphilus]
MAQHILRNERGTTLIQVLGAVIILTMIILSFVGISQYTTASNRDTDKRDKALFIAEEIVNNLRAGVTTYDLSGTETETTTSGFKYRIKTETLSTGVTDIEPFKATPITTRNQLTLTFVTGGTPELYAVTVIWGG